MFKVNPHIDRGTGYVLLSRLPFDQVIKLREFMPQSSFTSIETEKGTLEDALEYSQYEYWFDFHHKSCELDYEI
jgi:hypothetical protein